MSKFMIFGIHLTNRVKSAVDVQKVFTEYGCNIRTRLGLHDVNENFCSPSGLVILECYGDDIRCKEMEAKLRAIEGVEVQKMVFGGGCGCSDK